MAEKIDVNSPVTVVSDSKHRVALDLATKIDYYSNLKSENKDRRYWLTLYRQCYKAVNGSPLEKILEEA